MRRRILRGIRGLLVVPIATMRVYLGAHPRNVAYSEGGFIVSGPRRIRLVLVALAAVLACLAFLWRSRLSATDRTGLEEGPVKKKRGIGSVEPRPSAPDVPVPPSSTAQVPSRPDQSSRVGSGLWFGSTILHKLIRKIDELDSEGNTGKGLSHLLEIIRRKPSTFQERMLQAGAVRLVPYAVRGSDQLQLSATIGLRDLLLDADIPAFTSMSAMAALYGYHLNYNVRSFVSGPPGAENIEIYHLFYHVPFDKDQPDTYNFKGLAAQDAGLQEILRRLVTTSGNDDVVDTAARTLATNPGAGDVPVLLQSLHLPSVDIATKEWIIKSVARTATPEVQDALLAIASSAPKGGSDRLGNACREALVEFGQVFPALLKQCREVIEGSDTSYTWSGAVDVLTMIHLKRQSAESFDAIISLMSNVSLPSANRVYAIRKIAGNRDRTFLDFLKARSAVEQDERVRAAMEDGVDRLSQP